MAETASRIAAELVAEGLLTALGGNLSWRARPDCFWISAAGRLKQALAAEDWLPTQLSGEPAAPWPEGRQPSSEWRVHAAIYRQRPEIGAIIHGHGPAGLGWGLIADRLPCVHTELALLGPVSVLDWVSPGGDALAEAVASELATDAAADALLLRQHGFVALGRDLAWAATAARILETGARIALDARAAGTDALPEIAPAEAARLRQTYGSPGRAARR